MADTANLEILSTRAGFNSAVRHIKKTMEIAGETGNLGDIIYEMDDSELTSGRISLLLRMLLIDKLGYKSASINLHSTVNDIDALAKEFGKWNGVDLVAAYYHTELGLLIANPKVAEELESFGELRKRELMVVYAGFQGKETDDNCQKAADLALRMFEGSKVTVPDAITKGKFTVKKVSKPKKAEEQKPVKEKTVKGKPAKKAPVKEAAAAPVNSTSGGSTKMTPRYSVVVSNELFHNGNVEAWKKIVASYKAKHPNLDVYIYYEGERILDINSLFKWGKVKHGTAIEFAVAGDNIQDVAKLQRYLAQGASQMFEAFLRGSVSTVLKLF
ncbi:MAG: hypothetical protein FWC22_04265 [Treponema sp.]|nr:hypothetical protein [Treponema sp.]